MISAERYHDFSCGHRVYGHESKCAHLHGHNYRVTFTIVPDQPNQLDQVGRVMDFSVIKTLLCVWLEENWDHRFLVWEKDPMLPSLKKLDPEGVIAVPFNPTAENMAQWLVTVLAPKVLEGRGCFLKSCKVEETRKCSAIFAL